MRRTLWSWIIKRVEHSPYVHRPDVLRENVPQDNVCGTVRNTSQPPYKVNMPVKVIMTWDIAAERDQEYFEFVVGEFVPGVQRLGMQPAEAWATIYGPYPQIQVGLLVSDAPQARRILRSSDWGLLQDRLFGYVKNFSYKVVPARNGFQF